MGGFPKYLSCTYNLSLTTLDSTQLKLATIAFIKLTRMPSPVGWHTKSNSSQGRSFAKHTIISGGFVNGIPAILNSFILLETNLVTIGIIRGFCWCSDNSSSGSSSIIIARGLVLTLQKTSCSLGPTFREAESSDSSIAPNTFRSIDLGRVQTRFNVGTGKIAIRNGILPFRKRRSERRSGHILLSFLIVGSTRAMHGGGNLF
mmetsp:Transcript_15848/g.29912  ORF Transcript_15848/g.29912 Transcript_15848/m.29912 type:complete len:203 (+) Transcript_15848:119-727(+)